MKNILKLFYKPEEIEFKKPDKNLKFRLLGILIFVLIVAFATDAFGDSTKYAVGSVTITLMLYFGLILKWLFIIIFGVALYSAAIKFIGFIVGGKASFYQVLISQIYMLIPITIFKAIIWILNATFTGAFASDVDASLNFDVFIAISDVALLICYTYLNTKMIAKVQKIAFKKAILNNIILIAFVLITLLGSYKTVINDLDSNYRNGQKEFNAEQEKIMNQGDTTEDGDLEIPNE